MLPPCTVLSPMRAAGLPPIITVPEPAAMVSGGPTQVTISPARAAGMPAIITVGHPGGITGPPTCGTTPVTIGQVCISPTCAAIPIKNILIDIYHRSFYIRSSAGRKLGTTATFNLRLRASFQGQVGTFYGNITARLHNNILRTLHVDAV